MRILLILLECCGGKKKYFLKKEIGFVGGMGVGRMEEGEGVLECEKGFNKYEIIIRWVV